MRDWVKPFLLKNLNENLDILGLEKDFNKDKVIHIFKEIQDDSACCSYLTDKLSTHFGIGMVANKNVFIEMFGSVLSDLPEKVFLKLREMRNVFYTFTPIPGAEVKHFIFEVEKIDPNKWDRFIVVTFPYATIFMPYKAARGEVAHKLAHLYLHSDMAALDEYMEEEANQEVIEWGFSEEIEALREYQKEDYWGRMEVARARLAHIRPKRGAQNTPCPLLKGGRKEGLLWA